MWFSLDLLYYSTQRMTTHMGQVQPVQMLLYTITEESHPIWKCIWLRIIKPNDFYHRYRQQVTSNWSPSPAWVWDYLPICSLLVKTLAESSTARVMTSLLLFHFLFLLLHPQLTFFNHVLLTGECWFGGFLELSLTCHCKQFCLIIFNCPKFNPESTIFCLQSSSYY